MNNVVNLPTAGDNRVTVMIAWPFVTLEKFHELTGYGIRAAELKIERGVWIEGREWKKAPDGRRLMSLEGYCRWVNGEAA